MNKYILILISLGLIFLYSCKSKEDKAKEIVNNFMKQISDKNTKKENVNFNDLSDDYKKLFIHNYYFPSNDWTLTAEPESDTSIIVSATGKTFNGFGWPRELHQEFAVKKRNGEWKITNSFNVLDQFINFFIVDKRWEFYWDKEKHDILEDLKKNLKIEVLVKGYSEYNSEYAKGRVKVINDSDYDINSVKILMEHFDNDGNSINTDDFIIHAIKKHSYTEYDWIIDNCSKCVRQEFKILLTKETN